MKQLKIWWLPLLVLIAQTSFFVLLFYVDNKYQTPPPYGKSGVITLCEQDLERDTPVFLIDGWMLSDERVTDQYTYIGEFSNLQRGNPMVSPHGQARYEMTLRYRGASIMAAVDFPQLSSQYSIFIDGVKLTQGTGNGQVIFTITPGDHVLSVETSSREGYYSGMYFPPACSEAKTILRMKNIQSFSYALAVLIPVVLAAFTMFLWRSGGSLSRWFGMLCCCYAFYMFRYFVFHFDMPVARYWFLVQSLALYGLCFCVVRLTACASGADSCKAWRRTRIVLVGMSLVLLLLCFLIPVIPWAVLLHGKITNLYYFAVFCCSIFYAVRGIRVQNLESRYTLTGCLVFGMGLIVNLFFSNRFEPILFFWQFEWCGLLLVLLFGAMMVSRSHRLVRENDALTNHLEEQVKKRTEEVTQLLEERKAFFSDMAHDLKAPVFATQSFIKAIRSSGVGVDSELQSYLDQAEEKQWEMARRLQGLSSINALDRIEGERVRVSLLEMLSEIYAAHHGEAEVQSVYLIVEEPAQDAFLLAQPEKLNLLFENLIYNALRATPRNGSITVSAQVESDKIRLTVKDTGCGIPEEELPLVFRRFYVGANNRETGTGLGLYIVHSIVTELGGAIHVRSVVGKGTKFIMEFPQAPSG